MCAEFVTDPSYGGKITCHACGGFIREDKVFVTFQVGVFFHYDCFNKHEHYYGLDKPEARS
jgi:hypothetical protein